MNVVEPVTLSWSGLVPPAPATAGIQAIAAKIPRMNLSLPAIWGRRSAVAIGASQSFPPLVLLPAHLGSKTRSPSRRRNSATVTLKYLRVAEIGRASCRERGGVAEGS